MTNNIIAALRAHALIIVKCTEANRKIAAMTAENMQREAVGSSMAYGDEAFDKVEIPSYNEVIAEFNE
ncbi:hypothetical protein M0R72_06315 [Candidatus Pacearchaeota archaeon]|jgi:hypothetical protein|nr:hypothetical protein [Candidatus Pacearchaeota archaeon]